ncbi:MAG TPA: hypothetical protein VGH42_14250 [Verrucomicrobiae bacterium]|jgi:hypothetical protein
MLFAAPAIPSNRDFFVAARFDFGGAAASATVSSIGIFAARFVRAARMGDFFMAGMDAGFIFNRKSLVNP